MPVKGRVLAHGIKLVHNNEIRLITKIVGAVVLTSIVNNSAIYRYRQKRNNIHRMQRTSKSNRFFLVSRSTSPKKFHEHSSTTYE